MGIHGLIFNRFVVIPTAAYGIVMLGAGVAYWVLQPTIIRSQGANSALAKLIGRDLKGKLSPLLYPVAIGCAFIHPALAGFFYVAVAIM